MDTEKLLELLNENKEKFNFLSVPLSYQAKLVLQRDPETKLQVVFTNREIESFRIRSKRERIVSKSERFRHLKK